MKHLFKISMLSCALSQITGSPSLCGQTAPTPPAAKTANAPRIQFQATTFDFGKVQPTDKPRHEFIFTNTGNAVLEITDVHPGCGCTTAGTWDRKVEPGQIGRIPLQFSPANFSGTVSKGATVTCNDPVQGSFYLQFQATIFRPLDMQPQYAYFLPVEGEATNETKIIRIVNNQDEAVTLQQPHSSTPVFQTELKTIKPGKEFELHVTYAGPVSNANQNGNITINTSSTNLPTLSLNAMVMPQPAVIAVPQPIHLPPGPFSPEYRYPVTVRNNSSTPIKLSDPSVNAEGVTVQMQEVQPGKNFTLNLGFTSNFRVQPGQPVELAVKTSHPKYPVLKMPITQSAPPVPAPQVIAPTPQLITPAPGAAAGK